jgi:glyoxylase-like metal-dependent hydrolase (beta-lactamase superfamily II)
MARSVIGETAMRRRVSSLPYALLLAACAAAPFGARAQAPGAGAPLVKQDARLKVADHTFVILDDNVGLVPNVGIVVGERATLVVDTGLGDRNGRIVLGEARKVTKGGGWYVTATHFHPEHDLGATAFPADAKVVRWSGQQQEADLSGAATIERFKAFSPAVAELLNGARFRAPDIVFEDAVTIDLGGVHVRAFGVGPNHTLGDTAFFVVEDRVLFTGDTVMSVFPAVSGASADLAKWQRNLDEYEALQPRVVVPAHGKLGDVAFIRRYRDYFGAVQSRTTAAKRGGATLEAAQMRLTPGLASEFADLAPAAGAPAGRIDAAIQAAYRQAP